MKEITAQIMTTENFSPFGTLIFPNKERITFSNRFVDHYNDLANLETVGKDPVVSYFSCCRREFVVTSLERHALSAEIFFPVRGTACMPFAPSLPDGNPDIDGMKVFICREGHPFTAERGVWHLFPFPVTENYASYLIVERELIDHDLESREIAAPCRIVL